METKNLYSEILICLKKCIRGKNKANASIADKTLFNMYIDYIIYDVLNNSDKAKTIFKELQDNPDNLKLEGKFELLLESAIEDSEKAEHIVDKTQQMQAYFKESDGSEQESKKSEKDKTIDSSENKEEEIEMDNIDNESVEDDEYKDLYQLNEEGTIMVPWDFSDIAQYALDAAITYSNKMKGDIYLIHVVKREKDIASATKKLDNLIDDLHKKYDNEIKYLIKEGSIFTTITEVAENLKAKLVVMGTHGMKGMQKLTGSYALKVIVDSKSPFLVVQKAPKSEDLKKVIFPIDHQKETRQKLKQAGILAEHFPTILFEICRISKAGSSQFERLTTTNVNYAKSYFRQKKIEHKTLVLEGSNLSDAINKYAKRSNADMIIITTTKNINIADYMVGPDEQKIIFNKAEIPVMCVNPQKGKYIGMSGFGAAQ